MVSRGRLLLNMVLSKDNLNEITTRIEDTNQTSVKKDRSYQRTCEWINKSNFEEHNYCHGNVEHTFLNINEPSNYNEKINKSESDCDVVSNSDTTTTELLEDECIRNLQKSSENFSVSKVSSNPNKTNSDEHLDINTDLTQNLPLYSKALDIYDYKSDSIENDNSNDKDFDINDYNGETSSNTETESTEKSLESEVICEPAPLIFEHEKSKKNLGNKDMFCKFCCRDIATKNFMRHITRNHSNENEIKNILKFPKNSKERRKALGLLRNSFNFDLYLEGIVRPNRHRFNKTADDEHIEYVPCAYCKGLFDRCYLKRHIKFCTVFTANENQLKGKRKNLLSLSHTLTACAVDRTNVISQLNVKKQVFDLMKGDEIAFEVKKDLLIANLGNSYLKKHKRERLAYACSNQMRELSRLLINFRKIINNEKVHLKDLLLPKYFDEVIFAVRNIAGYDPVAKTFNSPSLAMHLGTSLKSACDELSHLIIKESQGFKCHSPTQRKQWLENVENFKKLIESRWNIELGSLANKDLQEKRWNKPLLLPLVSDIKKFKDETIKIANNCKQLFLNKEDDEKTYKELVQCVLSLLIVFNRRRIGDVQFMKIKDYERDTRNCTTDFESVLTQTEKVLTRKYKRVINTGKGSRAVVVLIPELIQDFINILLKNRNKYIPLDNKYIFAMPGSTIEWGKGDVAIRSLVKKIQLENAEAFSSNKLRKQIATVMQILNLSKGEIKQFSDFLGHTLKTHEEFYELPVDIYQTAKVSKILLMMEKGSTPGEYKGKSLEEISFDANLEYAEENNGHDFGSETVLNNEWNETQADILQDDNEQSLIADLSDDLPLTTFEETPTCSEKPGDPQDGTALETSIIKKNVIRKKIWTEKENALIKKNFGRYIKTGTYPASCDIKTFISQTKINRSIPIIKSKIQHLIKIKSKK